MRHWVAPFGMLALVALAGCEKLPEIPNIPPTAAFVYSPVSPINAGSTDVTFNATGSRDADGTITRYAWDFGDGTPAQQSGQPVITHVFPDTSAFCQEIVYTTLLTVTDNGNDTGTANQQVRVIEQPTPTSQACLQQR